MKDHSHDFGKRFRNSILIGFGAFVVINGCSWNPGYGSRRDAPGAEVERYFGWPSCFYADLWRSEEPMNILDIEPWAYAPPVPATTKMSFVYCNFGILPFLLDLVLIVAGTGLLMIFKQWEGRGSVRLMMLGGILMVIAWSIIRFGDTVSVYL